MTEFVCRVDKGMEGGGWMEDNLGSCMLNKVLEVGPVERRGVPGYLVMGRVMNG